MEYRLGGLGLRYAFSPAMHVPAGKTCRCAAEAEFFLDSMAPIVV